jgi:sugar lactone lactonase YvrE
MIVPIETGTGTRHPSGDVSVVGGEQYDSVAAKLIGFVEGVWHPEDLVRLEGTPWVVVSAMRSIRGRGALLAVDVMAERPAFEIEWSSGAERGRRSAEAFDPHGIDVRVLPNGRHEMLVVDHGRGEAIDRLQIDARKERPIVVSGEQIEQPIGTSGNAVAFLPGGKGFFISSMFDPRDPDVLGKFARAEITGSVWRWTEQAGWIRVGPNLSGANGIAVSPDGRHLFVSEWAARKIWKLSTTGAIEAQVSTGFLPDNLRWRSDGRLLLAGQKARAEAVFGCEARGDPCPLAFATVHLDPKTLSVTSLVEVDEDTAAAIGFGGATGALQVGHELWIGSFTGHRLARFRSTSKDGRAA